MTNIGKTMLAFAILLMLIAGITVLQWVMRLEEICQKPITQQASSPDFSQITKKGSTKMI